MWTKIVEDLLREEEGHLRDLRLKKGNHPLEEEYSLF